MTRCAVVMAALASLVGPARGQSPGKQPPRTSRPEASCVLLAPAGRISRRFGMHGDEDRTLRAGLVNVDAGGLVRTVFQGPSQDPDILPRLAKQMVRDA